MNEQTVRVNVNGASHDLWVEPRTLLSDVLRHHLGLTGTHVGCEQGACGACTVIIDGRAQRSCLVLALQADDAMIETIEGGPPRVSTTSCSPRCMSSTASSVDSALRES